jgi:hypothetical protein
MPFDLMTFILQHYKRQDGCRRHDGCRRQAGSRRQAGQSRCGSREIEVGWRKT